MCGVDYWDRNFGKYSIKVQRNNGITWMTFLPIVNRLIPLWVVNSLGMNFQNFRSISVACITYSRKEELEGQLHSSINIQATEKQVKYHYFIVWILPVYVAKLYQTLTNKLFYFSFYLFCSCSMIPTCHLLFLHQFCLGAWFITVLQHSILQKCSS